MKCHKMGINQIIYEWYKHKMIYLLEKNREVFIGSSIYLYKSKVSTYRSFQQLIFVVNFFFVVTLMTLRLSVGSLSSGQPPGLIVIYSRTGRIMLHSNNFFQLFRIEKSNPYDFDCYPECFTNFQLN
jgi:hypothetical protein